MVQTAEINSTELHQQIPTNILLLKLLPSRTVKERILQLSLISLRCQETLSEGQEKVRLRMSTLFYLTINDVYQTYIE